MTITKIVKCNICGKFEEIGPTDFYPYNWRLIHIYRTGLVDMEHPKNNVAGEEYDFAVCPEHENAELVFADGAIGILSTAGPED